MIVIKVPFEASPLCQPITWETIRERYGDGCEMDFFLMLSSKDNRTEELLAVDMSDKEKAKKQLRDIANVMGTALNLVFRQIDELGGRQ